MRLVKEYPIFSFALASLIATVLAGCALGFLAYRKADVARQAFDRDEQRLHKLLEESPAPTDANLEVARFNLSRLQELVTKRLAATKAKLTDFENRNPVPASRSQMFFQLQAYRNQLTIDASNLAKQNYASRISDGEDSDDVLDVLRLPENFSFGFSRYLNEPPADEDIGYVHRQKIILEHIIRKLFQSYPHSIEAVMRQSVSGQTVKPVNNRQSRFQDEFEIPDHLTAARDGVVATLAFKVEFTGFTQSLRLFLSQIERFELPIIVRSVEVSPGKVATTIPKSIQSSDVGFQIFFNNDGTLESVTEQVRDPVVTNNISHFSVILEYIEVLYDTPGSGQTNP